MTSPGMSTFIWGPLFWDLMADMAIRMDQTSSNNSKNYNGIWYTLKNILPCKYCRQSYRKFIREDPPARPYTKWVCALQNKVNIKLEKPLFEWEKFQRRCHVYGSFSSPTTWWDIHFILALNYDPDQKRAAYSQWFQLVPLMSGLLPYVTFQNTIIPRSVLSSKLTLLRWLTEEYNHQHQFTQTTEFFVRKYANAIAHKTPEELARLCGPLIVQCQQLDQKRNK